MGRVPLLFSIHEIGIKILIRQKQHTLSSQIYSCKIVLALMILYKYYFTTINQIFTLRIHHDADDHDKPNLWILEYLVDRLLLHLLHYRLLQLSPLWIFH